jgi:subtilisin family serine protease
VDLPALGLPHRITREWAWGDGTGAGVKVAVVDSGVEPDHPSVRGVAGGIGIEHAPDEPGQVRFGEEHEDLCGHGTACASVIRELAPEAEIYSVRVLGAQMTGRGVVFAAGLRWAIDNGMDVVNLSLSTGRKEFFGTFHELADAAYFRNVMLVSAANNAPMASYPSLYSSVLSVASTDGQDREAWSYNPEPPVEFGAPGIDVPVGWLNGETITATGNSFAAPVIAGLTTRILGEHPGLTPFQVKTILRELADNVVPPTTA